MNSPFMGAGGGGASFAGAPQLSAVAPAPVAQTPVSPAPPASVPSGIVPGAPADGVTPNPADATNAFSNTAAATEGQTPLDEYSKIYDNKETPQGQQVPDVLAATIGEFNTAAGKLDFTRGIDPALAEKALGGDPESLLLMMNNVARNAFAQSSYSSSQITKNALDTRMEGVTKSLPEMLRKQQANAGLIDNNSNLSHPAVQPIVHAVQAQIAKQFPEATAAELQAHTMKYMQSVGTLFNPSTEAGGNTGQLPEGDTGEGWTDFFS